ncbi:MAG: hypothetical protein LBP56_09315 [Odoribacteraceae bacterium]|jgi:hypothetical protein|nr:hypothetical protein [Odoribacteraceae bacterium]
MKLKLKQVRYNSASEALFLIIGGTTFCGFLLYLLLTGAKSPINATIIISFIFFGSCLLIGIWQLLKKKTTDTINVNGWQYKLFKKSNKLPFILISGLYKVYVIPVVLLVVWFIQDIPISGILWYIACGLILLVVLVPLLGYLEYKKFRSMENVGDKMLIFPKDKNSKPDVL